MEVRYQLRYSPVAPAYRPEQLMDPNRSARAARNRPGSPGRSLTPRGRW